MKQVRPYDETLSVVDVLKGEFAVPSEREIALHERLGQYYTATEDLDNRQALSHHKALTKWWKDRGYTQEEFNAAKRNYWNSVR